MVILFPNPDLETLMPCSSDNFASKIAEEPTVPPLSGWYSVGSEIPATVSVQDESCSTAVFLSAQILTSLANCENVCNGSILINPIGGTAPYQYSINNGTTFQSSNIFSSDSWNWNQSSAEPARWWR